MNFQDLFNNNKYLFNICTRLANYVINEANYLQLRLKWSVCKQLHFIARVIRRKPLNASLLRAKLIVYTSVCACVYLKLSQFYSNMAPNQLIIFAIKSYIITAHILICYHSVKSQGTVHTYIHMYMLSSKYIMHFLYCMYIFICVYVLARYIENIVQQGKYLLN